MRKTVGYLGMAVMGLALAACPAKAQEGTADTAKNGIPGGNGYLDTSGIHRNQGGSGLDTMTSPGTQGGGTMVEPGYQGGTKDTMDTRSTSDSTKHSGKMHHKSSSKKSSSRSKSSGRQGSGSMSDSTWQNSGSNSGDEKTDTSSSHWR